MSLTTRQKSFIRSNLKSNFRALVYTGALVLGLQGMSEGFLFMKNTKIAKFALASTFVVWGSVGIFVKYIPLNSGLIALDRSIVGMLFLILVKLFTKSKFDFSAIRKSLPLLCINGALLGFNWILLFESYNFTSVAISTICYNIGPIFVMLFSPIVFKEKLSKKQLGALAMIMVALAMLNM